jgi:hypothetical protein
VAQHILLQQNRPLSGQVRERIQHKSPPAFTTHASDGMSQMPRQFGHEPPHLWFSSWTGRLRATVAAIVAHFRDKATIYIFR